MNVELNVIQPEAAVDERYSQAAGEREPALCCPIDYNPEFLKILPEEIIEKDYGCGDPSAYVRNGDVVLDLGSGGGKLCYIASQIVGPNGKVWGVDRNPDMLQLARKYQPEMAEKVGFDNVAFFYGRIQDLGVDLEKLGQQIDELDAQGVERSSKVLDLMSVMRQESPMIPDNSVDCVISNCVLNLVNPRDRVQLFEEIFRVLKPGGRAAISDIVSDRDIPDAMKNDAQLWSGCISGAWREDKFLEAFLDAGFVDVSIDRYQEEPWQTIDSIDFRSMTVLAVKPLDETNLDLGHAVIYKGPYAFVQDDTGLVCERGVRTAVGHETFARIASGHLSDQFVLLEPVSEMDASDAEPFDNDLGLQCVPIGENKHRVKGASSASSCCQGGDCC
ncbi:MAG: methyltransferase domain-containing protein [Pirellulaceae bacterium]